MPWASSQADHPTDPERGSKFSRDAEQTKYHINPDFTSATWLGKHKICTCGLETNSAQDEHVEYEWPACDSRLPSGADASDDSSASDQEEDSAPRSTECNIGDAPTIKTQSTRLIEWDIASTVCDKNSGCIHACRNSCFRKTGDKCKNGYPKKLHVRTHIQKVKGGRFRIKLRRDHQRMVPINRWVTAALKCNTAVILLATGRDAQASAFYITDYMTKAPHKSHQLNLICAGAVQKYQ